MSYERMSLANGYIERKAGGRYEGQIVIEGVDLSPITGMFFKDGERIYLWLRRNDILEYDHETLEYKTRKREPRWEAYLEKTFEGNVTMFKGEFNFLMFRFSVTGLWDEVLGLEKSRLNLYVERLSMERQDIINGINKRRKSE